MIKMLDERLSKGFIRKRVKRILDSEAGKELLNEQLNEQLQAERERAIKVMIRSGVPENEIAKEYKITLAEVRRIAKK